MPEDSQNSAAKALSPNKIAATESTGGPMLDALTRHSSLHEDIDSVLSLLEGRLSTVLSPSAPTPPENPSRDSIGSSDLVMAIENSSDKMANHRNRVRNMLDSLEI